MVQIGNKDFQNIGESTLIYQRLGDISTDGAEKIIGTKGYNNIALENDTKIYQRIGECLLDPSAPKEIGGKGFRDISSNSDSIIYQRTPCYILLSVTATATSNVLCHGESNGSANGSASGGSGSGYSYSWQKASDSSEVSTSQNPENLPAGTYKLVVTDSVGGTGTSSNITINEPAVISITTSSKSNVAIAGGTTGGISISVSGGKEPYSYSWNNGADTQNLSNIPDGTYTVTVTDENGCTQTYSDSISENPVITVTATVNSHVLCNGESNGSANSSASGGSGSGYSYSWQKASDSSEVSTSQNPDNLPAGTYKLVVTDSVGGTGTSSNITINEPDLLTITSVTLT